MNEIVTMATKVVDIIWIVSNAILYEYQSPEKFHENLKWCDPTVIFWFLQRIDVNIQMIWQLLISKLISCLWSFLGGFFFCLSESK